MARENHKEGLQERLRARRAYGALWHQSAAIIKKRLRLLAARIQHSAHHAFCAWP